MRGVTVVGNGWMFIVQFQLTRLMRGVTHVNQSLPKILIISTHTPHARRDCNLRKRRSEIQISTHTPHARRDLRKIE